MFQFPSERLCKQCGKVRPLFMFPKPHKYVQWCQLCTDRALERQPRSNVTISKPGAGRKERSVSFRAHKLRHRAKARAKQLGLEFDLSRNWTSAKVRRGVCDVTGIRFELNYGYRGPFSPSIDRIDPSRGYTEDNSRLVIWAYNCAKSTWSDEHVLKMAQALVSRSAGNVVPFDRKAS